MTHGLELDVATNSYVINEALKVAVVGLSDLGAYEREHRHLLRVERLLVASQRRQSYAARDLRTIRHHQPTSPETWCWRRP
ncbi:MAG: hypothetical protein ACRDV2_15955 [Actinomycetes bacterium]